MRNYKAKMAKYRLPEARYAELREFCLCSDSADRQYITHALELTVNDDLARWLYLHVVSTDYGWAKLEAEGLPCSRDTFRVYRAKFYWHLDRILNGASLPE